MGETGLTIRRRSVVGGLAAAAAASRARAAPPVPKTPFADNPIELPLKPVRMVADFRKWD